MLRHRSSRTSVAEEVELPTYANGFYDICHPLFIGSMAAAILSRTLRQFSPDTLVIRRVHRQHHQNESAARSRVSRTAGGHTPRDVSLLSSSDVQQIRLVPPSSHTNTNNNADDLESLRSGGGARRTRSADVQEPRRVLQPLSVGKPRSQSDDRLQRRPTSSRSTSRGLTLQGLSSSRMHSSSSVPNTTNNNNSGRSINASFTSDVSAPIVPPLKLGKPPLSGGRSLPPPAPLVVPDSARSERMRSTPRRDGDAHHRHRSSSSRPESLRSTPRGASRGADGRSSQQQQQQQHRSSERVGIFSRIMKANISRGVGLASHLLRAAPAVVLHACSSVKRQLIALPLMRFKDLSKQPRLMLALILPWANVVGGRAFPEEDEWKLLVEDEPYAMHLLISRAVLYVVGTYMKEAFFLDTSVVVRNLRSRNFFRHVLGWSLRITSHVVFDPLCISLITPLICVSAEARQNPSGAAGVVVDDGGGGGVGQLRWSWAGMLRASAVATAAVLVESVVCPIAVHLVDRAIITVMENVEYVMMRRYTILFSSSEEDETDDDVDDDDGTASRAASVVSAAVRRRARARRSGAHQRMTKEERQEQRDAAGRRAVMRAIVFRVAASLVAHCVVNHPMRVLVELLRGRAVLHATGLLAVYDDVGGDGLTWAALQQLWLRTTSASSPVAWMKMMAQWMGEEVNTIYSSICHASGQEEAIHALRELHMRDGAQPSAQESAQLLRRSLASLAPLYGGLAFTAMDKILSFYMSVWVRLTRS